jgi:uncharacterized protein YutD
MRMNRLNQQSRLSGPGRSKKGDALMALIHIGSKSYELVTEHKTAWNFEVFRDRFSEVLERYDYIVGDWGYNQLRLRGFFKENNPKATKESSIAYFQDYLNEYCNFGCAYFIIEKVANRNPLTENEVETDTELETE